MDKEEIIRRLKNISRHAVHVVGESPFIMSLDDGIALDDAIRLLKEQEEREKGICKTICDFIRGSCSVDTEADKEYVCHVIQQIFIKGSR